MVFQYYQVLGGCKSVVFSWFPSTWSIVHVFLVTNIFHPINSWLNKCFFCQRFWGALLWSMVWSQTCGTKETSTCQVSGNQKISWGLHGRSKNPILGAKACTLDVHISDDFFKRNVSFFCQNYGFVVVPVPGDLNRDLCVSPNVGVYQWPLISGLSKIWKFLSNQDTLRGKKHSSLLFHSFHTHWLLSGSVDNSQSRFFSNHLSKQHQI